MVLVFSSAILFSVEATRNFIFNAVIKWQEDYFSLEHNDIITENPIVYRSEYLPSGFKEISSNVIGDVTKIIYENENGMTIAFEQSPSQSSHILADHEDKNILL